MPNAMFAAIPPRRTTRSSTRKLRDRRWIWSATICSPNFPGKLIRWSVAMLPLTATGTVGLPVGLGCVGWAAERPGPARQVTWPGGCRTSPHTTEWYACPSLGGQSTFTGVTTPEADSIDELIADCADIPAGVRTAAPVIPGSRAAAGWTVPDSCVDQARQLDD